MIGVVYAPPRSGSRAFPVVTLIVLAIAAAACSSRGPIASASLPASTVNSSGQESAVNPCELVTGDEASSLLGGTTQRTGPTDENQLVVCKWETGQGANLLVKVGQGVGLYDPDLTNPGWQSVSALGDKAFSDAVTQTVGFIKGSTVVMLYAPAVQPVDMVDLEALARAVAGRLGSS